MFGRRKHLEHTARLDALTAAVESIDHSLTRILDWLDEERETNRRDAAERADQTFSVRRELMDLRDMLHRLPMAALADFLNDRRRLADGSDFNHELAAVCWALEADRLAELDRAMPDALTGATAELLSMDGFHLARITPLVDALHQHLDQTFRPDERQHLITELIATTTAPEDWSEKLAALRAETPDFNLNLPDAVEEQLLDISDLLHTDDDSIRRLLREVEMSDLVAALSGQPEAVVQRVLRAMARRLSEMVGEDIELAGDTPPAEVAAARRRVNFAIRRLRRAGAIHLGAEVAVIDDDELDDLLAELDADDDGGAAR